MDLPGSVRSLRHTSLSVLTPQNPGQGHHVWAPALGPNFQSSLSSSLVCALAHPLPVSRLSLPPLYSPDSCSSLKAHPISFSRGHSPDCRRLWSRLPVLHSLGGCTGSGGIDKLPWLSNALLIPGRMNSDCGGRGLCFPLYVPHTWLRGHTYRISSRGLSDNSYYFYLLLGKLLILELEGSPSF